MFVTVSDSMIRVVNSRNCGTESEAAESPEGHSRAVDPASDTTRHGFESLMRMLCKVQNERFIFHIDSETAALHCTLER